MTVIERAEPTNAPARRRTLTRSQKWMLVLAVEVLVYGCAQAATQPIRRPGISVEMPVKPNHMVT